MRVLGILSLVSMALTATAVAVRLLLLWRRTRERPELLLGLALLAIGALGVGCSAIGRMPGMVRTPVGDGAFAVGIAIANVGTVLAFAFTWQVFHAGQRWARMLVSHAALAAALITVGLVRASARGSELAEILNHTRPWACAMVALLVAAFVWGAVESGRYYGQQKRRMALGLADPIVANRFLLWSLANAATAVLCATVIACLAAGMAVLREPVPLTIIGAVGMPATVVWYLTFFPPNAYAQRVRRSAAASD